MSSNKIFHYSSSIVHPYHQIYPTLAKSVQFGVHLLTIHLFFYFIFTKLMMLYLLLKCKLLKHAQSGIQLGLLDQSGSLRISSCHVTRLGNNH